MFALVRETDKKPMSKLHDPHQDMIGIKKKSMVMYMIPVLNPIEINSHCKMIPSSFSSYLFLKQRYTHVFISGTIMFIKFIQDNRV